MVDNKDAILKMQANLEDMDLHHNKVVIKVEDMAHQEEENQMFLVHPLFQVEMDVVANKVNKVATQLHKVIMDQVLLQAVMVDSHLGVMVLAVELEVEVMLKFLVLQLFQVGYSHHQVYHLE